MPVFNALLPESLKITQIQYWLLVLSLAHRDFSIFSESFDDIIYYRRGKVQNLQYYIEEHFEIALFRLPFTLSALPPERATCGASC